jgi:hypothetical protein
MTTLNHQQRDKELLKTLYRSLRRGDSRAARYLNRSSGRDYSVGQWVHMLAPACQRLGAESHD